MNRITTGLCLLLFVTFIAGTSFASLTTFQQFSGAGVNLSTDGWGSTSQSGQIQASVPVGATVLGAYLYSSTYFTGTPALTFQGQNLTNADFTALGALGSACCGLQAFRTDVTSIVAPMINGGPGGIYNFNITENGVNQDGEALVVVYKDPSNSAIQTVGIMDGYSVTTGDSATINFADPLHPADPGFVADMRLGIGFSCCSQSSNVTVNGTLITQNAGNNDDSVDSSAANGNLITMGGFNDPYSTLLPSYADDHERYNLTPYITDGSTSIHILTQNPTGDDNIFLATFLVSGNAAINPPSQVPEPASLVLLGSGIAGLWTKRKLRN